MFPSLNLPNAEFLLRISIITNYANFSKCNKKMAHEHMVYDTSFVYSRNITTQRVREMMMMMKYNILTRKMFVDGSYDKLLKQLCSIYHSYIELTHKLIDFTYCDWFNQGRDENCANKFFDINTHAT
jgi:hypothetical protein